MGVSDSHAIVPQHIEVDTISNLGNQGAENLSQFSELQSPVVLTTENLSLTPLLRSSKFPIEI